MPQPTTIHGIDFEEIHIEKAWASAKTDGLQQRLTYGVANANSLPFADGTFDMVTCQTVLIHVPEVLPVLTEMLRVLKPGGLIVAAEPNNVASNLVESSISIDAPLEQKLMRVELALTCENGKKRLGEGHNSVGDVVPCFMANAGVKEINVCLNDKVPLMLPPYESAEQMANAKQILEWNEIGFLGFRKQVALRFFVAGGGKEDRFDLLWEMQRKSEFEQCALGIQNMSYYSSAGCVFYLISGRKPH